MTVTRRLAFVLACLLLIVGATTFAQQQPSRLLVTNKTSTTVEVFAAVRDTWQSRGRISPGSSLPVYNVANGQRFRAVWGSNSRTHVVALKYDRGYGGWQDVLVLP